MRGLTLRQPWAWAIAHAGKRVENRTWRPPRDARGGLLAIHAGKSLDREGLDHLRILDLQGEIPAVPSPSELTYGAVVAVARLLGTTQSPPGSTHPQAIWWQGPIGWVLRDVVALSLPVHCRGAQGLWTLPADVEAPVLADPAMREAA